MTASISVAIVFVPDLLAPQRSYSRRSLAPILSKLTNHKASQIHRGIPIVKSMRWRLSWEDRPNCSPGGVRIKQNRKHRPVGIDYRTRGALIQPD